MWKTIDGAPVGINVLVWDCVSEECAIGSRDSNGAAWYMWHDDIRLVPSHWMELPGKPDKDD